MSEYKYMYQILGIIIFFYISYQAYLVSKIPNSNQIQQLTKLNDDLRESVKTLDHLEKQQNDFKKLVKDAHAKLQSLEKIKKEKNPNIPEVPKKVPNENHVENLQVPVLVIACNRPTVSRALDSILSARTNGEMFPIVVSQDCGHAATLEVIKKYANSNENLQYIEQTDRSEPWKVKKSMLGYYKLSRHYKFALDSIFRIYPESHGVIIVEDDLEVSPDFFNYFEATSQLLLDPVENLYCISAWNDNGKEGQISQDPKLLHRTDFFGGLGWMLKKTIWTQEWTNQWPEAFWDDWVRHQDRRKERECIRPEISRTSTFGKIGVSNGQFFDKHLAHIHHNTQAVTWSSGDIDNLRKSIYDENFLRHLEKMPTVKFETLSQDIQKLRGTGDLVSDPVEVKLVYQDKKDFIKIAKSLMIMEDFKAGVPRGGYKGVVQTVRNQVRIYITPPDPATWQYDTKW